MATPKKSPKKKQATGDKPVSLFPLKPDEAIKKLFGVKKPTKPKNK
jgi:hypothetical protein